MNTSTAIASRRNVREFTDEDISDADMGQILEAARRAPSSRNAQWWDLVLVTEPDRLRQLAEVWQGAGHVARAKAAIAVVAPEGDDERQRNWISFDLGQMTMQFMLAAADLGIGTGHAAVRDQDLAREILGFPEDRRCFALISLGHPAGRPLTPIVNPKRRDLDDVVHRERW